MAMVRQMNAVYSGLVVAAVLLLSIASPAVSYEQNGENKYITELRAKAETGDAKAQYELGNAYFVGVGIVKNYGESVKWFRKAAEQGNAKAESSLGTMYFQGLGVTKDSAEAVKWWRKGAEQHNPDAQVQLGFAYLLGDGVPKNHVNAYMWFNLAAAKNDKHAIKDRDSVSRYMAGYQITEAQRLQKEWMLKHPEK